MWLDRRSSRLSILVLVQQERTVKRHPILEYRDITLSRTERELVGTCLDTFAGYGFWRFNLELQCFDEARILEYWMPLQAPNILQKPPRYGTKSKCYPAR
jgi:hypothetical protein